MTDAYRLFGSEMSPYSVKVRAWFRYKQVPHAWIARGPQNEAEYRAVAKLPIVPTLVLPTGEAMQDSTPMMEALETRHPEPAIHPDDPALAFLSYLLEEFGDEWANKLMFHHRWFAEIDAVASSRTLARLALPQAGDMEIDAQAARILERMSGRGHFVGSSPANAPLIRGYFVQLVDLLEQHLAGRRYLFGARPAFGDFGLAAQLYEASVDPTCGSIIRARAPRVLAWCQAMQVPHDDGPFEAWATLAPTLAPILAYVGRYFLPWSAANAEALARGEPEFTVTLAGQPYSQQPQKYHARSLAVLRERYRQVQDDAGLRRILDEAGCTAVLAAAG